MIRHVLLDADGVLQTIPGGGQVGRARPHVGERAAEVVARLFEDERPSLRGESDFRADLERGLESLGVDVDPDVLYADLWHAIEVSPEMVDLVRRLRSAGYGVHLGTNQHRQRAAYMRTTLGYDELVDVGCYSWELGAAKPDADFFERALELVDAPASEVLFIDDLDRNVDGARAAGLAAERWDLGEGLPALLALLEQHGVKVG